jgi:hypothetical protein
VVVRTFSQRSSRSRSTCTRASNRRWSHWTGQRCPWVLISSSQGIVLAGACPMMGSRKRQKGTQDAPVSDEAGRKASPAASPRSRRRHREVRVMWFQIGVLVVVTTIFAAEVRWILKA